jgi:hypothetical protein
MRTNLNKIFLGLTGAIVILLIVGHFQSLQKLKEIEQRQSEPERSAVRLPSLSIEQIGYFKGDNRLRYFTFYVSHGYQIVDGVIPYEMQSRIKAHGAAKMHTQGQVTASFYYLDRDATPDVTLLSAQAANDLAHDRKPIMSVWIMPNGQVNSFVNP